MSGPWYAGWSRIVVAVIAAWRIWAELKTVWPTVAVGREILLRHLWWERGLDDQGGPDRLPRRDR